MVLVPFGFTDARGNEYSVQDLGDAAAPDYWLCWRHPDGGWITQDQLTEAEVTAYWEKCKLLGVGSVATVYDSEGVGKLVSGPIVAVSEVPPVGQKGGGAECVRTE